MVVPETVGAKAIEEIAKTLNSALDSPATEIGNYIADKIRYLRYNSLLKIVRRAEEKATAAGMSLKMPPLKFFVPFCEGASLEEEGEHEEGEGSLNELWSGLFVSASTTFDSRHMVYLRLLKEITSNEAWFLDLLINESRARTFARPLSWESYSEAPFFNAHTVSLFMDNLPEDIALEESLPSFLDCLECPGVRVLDADLSEGLPFSRASHDLASYGFHTVEHAKVEIAIQVLSSLRVVDEFELHDFPLNSGKLFSMHAVRLTQLGAGFLGACGAAFSPPDFDQEITLY